MPLLNALPRTTSESDLKQAHRRLDAAVRQNPGHTPAGMSEKLFARLFRKLVYAQIWEDPDVDMEALAIQPGNRIVTIASGGCNALSYLIADPERIEAVDLNTAHIAFNRLKHAAVRHLPDYDAFFRFYGHAADSGNPEAYARFVRPHLDPDTRAYWDARTLTGRRRIAMFSRHLYRHGVLGRFIGAAHVFARMHGVDPSRMLEARDMAEQRRLFDETLAPLFEKPLVRWAMARKSSLFGLGIPPQQYDALATAGEGRMAPVLRQRLEKLACDFPLADNYFAWQAFGRGYGAGDAGPLPPYLMRDHFEAVRARVGRLTVVNASFTDFLAAKSAGSVDRFILLDAQDWMSDDQLNALWAEISRTAAPGARVIFRTAAAPSLLPGRVDDAILALWDYREDQSARLHARDRSSIYGGFHLYVSKAA